MTLRRPIFQLNRWLVLTKQWYNSVLARIHKYAFCIELAVGSSDDLLSSAAACTETEAAAAGNAVYMLPSMYNHDCGKLSLFLAYARLDYKGKLC
ncbi:hypothetical protein Peur_033462 [Populus x canadensis]